ncbi:hypothetical protein [Alteromonas macleodii]|uniref:hypothetical protein n=1 Tax=Alteromonas macleodii TaxID=28108 RepID=UPI0022B05B3C|nr:hypothetical protein [Alteromonas macleodii]MCZ4240468.1 hypothetical protein [Alteromonas macleodii]
MSIQSDHILPYYIPKSLHLPSHSISQLINESPPLENRSRMIEQIVDCVLEYLKRHTVAIDTLEGVNTDNDPFCLYLRNFSAESYPCEEWNIPNKVSSNIERTSSIVNKSGLEEFLETSFFPLDIVAVSNVFDYGSLQARLKMPNHDWLNRVRSLVASAHAIVLVLSELKPGVLDEIEMILELGKQGRTIVLLDKFEVTHEYAQLIEKFNTFDVNDASFKNQTIISKIKSLSMDDKVIPSNIDPAILNHPFSLLTEEESQSLHIGYMRHIMRSIELEYKRLAELQRLFAQSPKSFNKKKVNFLSSWRAELNEEMHSAFALSVCISDLKKTVVYLLYLAELGIPHRLAQAKDFVVLAHELASALRDEELEAKCTVIKQCLEKL